MLKFSVWYIYIHVLFSYTKIQFYSVNFYLFAVIMAPAALNKKKVTKSQKPPAQKKQKKEVFTAKPPKKHDISDDSDSPTEEIVDHEGLFEEENEEDGFDSHSEASSDGDDPFTDDFLQGGDDEGLSLPLFPSFSPSPYS